MREFVTQKDISSVYMVIYYENDIETNPNIFF